MRWVRNAVLSILLAAVLTSNARAAVFINEVLADPPTAMGISEFVELYNNGSAPVDLFGWSIADALRTRHTFVSNSIILPQSYYVVFGNLGLNNSGDRVSLFGQDSVLIDQMNYGSEGGRDQSLVRAYESPDAPFVLHTAISAEPFSPGESSFPVQNPTAVPEPASLLLALIGVVGARLTKYTPKSILN